MRMKPSARWKAKTGASSKFQYCPACERDGMDNKEGCCVTESLFPLLRNVGCL